MKRFTDTGKWSDAWFQDLSVTHKLFWQYLCDNCDNGGIWKVNVKAASFFIGAKLDAVKALEAFNDRVEDLGTGYWFLPKFCAFQYKVLKESAPYHVRALECLDKHGLKERVFGAYKKPHI
jgi:hypothetical protein